MARSSTRSASGSRWQILLSPCRSPLESERVHWNLLFFQLCVGPPALPPHIQRSPDRGSCPDWPVGRAESRPQSLLAAVSVLYLERQNNEGTPSTKSLHLARRGGGVPAFLLVL